MSANEIQKEHWAKLSTEIVGSKAYDKIRPALRRSDYDILEDGRVVRLRPAGSSLDLRYGQWRHPFIEGAIGIAVAGKEAADGLLRAMLAARDSALVSDEEWERKAEEAIRAKGLTLWRRGPSGERVEVPFRYV